VTKAGNISQRNNRQHNFLSTYCERSVERAVVDDGTNVKNGAVIGTPRSGASGDSNEKQRYVLPLLEGQTRCRDNEWEKNTPLEPSDIT